MIFHRHEYSGDKNIFGPWVCIKRVGPEGSNSNTCKFLEYPTSDDNEGDIVGGLGASRLEIV